MKNLLLLALLVFIAGCIGSNVEVNANNGLIVNEFSAYPSQAEADDVVSFLLDAENVGGTTARCVTTELFGVDSWYDQTGVPLSTLTTPVYGITRDFSFFYLDGSFNACYTDINRGQICAGYINDVGVALSGFIGSSFFDFANQYCTSLATFDPRLRLIDMRPELSPPVPSLGKAGQSFTTEWRLRPPILQEGLAVDYPITARTSYFYTTNAVMNIQAFNKEEARRRADLGQSIEYPLTVENSFGSPIQVFATRGESPAIINPTSFSGPYEYKSYRFEVANLGEGFPLPLVRDLPSISGPETQSGFIFATLSVNGPGVFFDDCLNQGGFGVTEVFISGDVIHDLVRLRGDQRVPVGCTIGIDRTIWADKPVGTITFNFNLWYRYYIDRQAVVRVVGVEGFSGGVPNPVI